MHDGLDRRQLLSGLSGVGAALLAGCGGSAPETDPGGGGGGGTRTRTDTPTDASDPDPTTTPETTPTYAGPDLDARQGLGTLYPSVSASEHVVGRISGATAIDHEALRGAGAAGVIPFDHGKTLESVFGGTDRLTGSVVIPLGTVSLLAGTGSIDTDEVRTYLSDSDATFETSEHEGADIWARTGYAVVFAGDTMVTLGFDRSSDLPAAEMTALGEAVLDASGSEGRYDSDAGYRRLVDSLADPHTAQLFRVADPSGDFTVPGTNAPLLGYTVGGTFTGGGLTVEYSGLSTRKIRAEPADVVEAVRSLLELEPEEDSASVDGESVSYTAQVSADAHPWLFVG